MKTRLLFTVILLSFFGRSMSQSFVCDVRRSEDKRAIDTCVLRVYYKFNYSIDTLRKIKYFERHALDIGENISHYYSLSAEEMDSTMWRARMVKTKQIDVGVDISKNLASREKPQYEDIFINMHEQQHTLTHRIRLINTDYQFIESYMPMTWKIEDEFMQIQGFSCQKATTTFGKRLWTAWFTTEIPKSMGPYKFNGLPGLILSIKDSDNLFNYEFMGVEQPIKRPVYNYFPIKKIITATRKEIYKLLTMRWQDAAGLFYFHGVSLGGYSGGKSYVVGPGNYSYPYIPTIELE